MGAQCWVSRVLCLGQGSQREQGVGAGGRPRKGHLTDRVRRGQAAPHVSTCLGVLALEGNFKDTQSESSQMLVCDLTVSESTRALVNKIQVCDPTPDPSV